MGVTHVTVVIRNPADPEKTWEGLFLVESLGEPLFSGRRMQNRYSFRTWLASVQIPHATAQRWMRVAEGYTLEELLEIGTVDSQEPDGPVSHETRRG